MNIFMSIVAVVIWLYVVFVSTLKEHTIRNLICSLIIYMFAGIGFGQTIIKHIFEIYK
jgi:hypothetical protein